VLAHHHLDRRLEALQDLGAELEFLRLTELGEVASVQHKIRLWGQVIDIVDRT
jgi:hypothetical protein